MKNVYKDMSFLLFTSLKCPLPISTQVQSFEKMCHFLRIIYYIPVAYCSNFIPNTVPHSTMVFGFVQKPNSSKSLTTKTLKR